MWSEEILSDLWAVLLWAVHSERPAPQCGLLEGGSPPPTSQPKFQDQWLSMGDRTRAKLIAMDQK